MHRPMPKTLVLGLNYAPEATGIAPYTAGLAAGLALRGTSTQVITAHPHYPSWRVAPGHGQWTSRQLEDGVDVTRVRHYVPRKPALINRALAELTLGARQVMRRWHRPDVIVTVSPGLFTTALVRLRAAVLHRRTPFLVWVQDLYSLGLTETRQGGTFGYRMLRAVEGRVLRSATSVVVIHDRFARRIIDEFGVAPERISVIRNWTHTPIDEQTDAAATRRRLGWSDDEAVVLHAGSMGVKQGLDNVLAAARIAAQRGDRVRFVFLGNGSQRARLVEAAAGLDNVDFVDTLPFPEFVSALEAADVLLVNEHPGVAEMAVPSKLTSYFAAGRPVLAATDLTGITADEIRRADAGVVVPSGDPDALVDAVATLRADPEERRRLGRNGRRFHTEVLGSDAAIDAFCALFDRLMRENGAVRAERIGAVAPIS